MFFIQNNYGSHKSLYAICIFSNINMKDQKNWHAIVLQKGFQVSCSRLPLHSVEKLLLNGAENKKDSFHFGHNPAKTMYNF